MIDTSRDCAMVSVDRLETYKGRDCKVCFRDHHGYEESPCFAH